MQETLSDLSASVIEGEFLDFYTLFRYYNNLRNTTIIYLVPEIKYDATPKCYSSNSVPLSPL